MKEAIPVVQRLTKVAPKLDGWKVISFRQRMAEYADTNLVYDGVEFDGRKVWFQKITTHGHFDLILCLPGYTEKNRDVFLGGAFILLDTALGELDVMTKVRYVDCKALPEDPAAAGLLPYAKLRETFDDYQDRKEAKKRLE